MTVLAFALLLVLTTGPFARAEMVDSRPYPFFEFLLADECVARDLAATTLIQTSGRMIDITPGALIRAYDLVLRARRDCAAGRIAMSLAKYDDAVAGLGHGAEVGRHAQWDDSKD